MFKSKRFASWLVIGFLISGTASAEKFASLVGINDYKDENIPNLRGCENDVSMMKEVLIEKFGFTTGKIQILLSDQATRSAIHESLQWLAAEAKPGDVVLFYFSGHGSQVPDQPDANAWDEADGLDETICPYDLQLGDKASHIRDDELSEWLKAINTDHLAIIFDSCPSGTAAQDLAFVNRRQTQPRAFVDDSFDTEIAEMRNLVLKRRKQKQRELEDTSTTMGQDLPYVLISGCVPGQIAVETAWPSLEGTFAGVLTKNLVDRLRLSPDGTTYAQLIVGVTREIKEKFLQTPQLEGVGKVHPVFSAKCLDKIKFILFSAMLRS